MPSSMARPAASRKVAKVAARGEMLRPVIVSASGVSSLPETRTTPMPPRPGAVAIAAMVSRETFSADLDRLLGNVSIIS